MGEGDGEREHESTGGGNVKGRRGRDGKTGACGQLCDKCDCCLFTCIVALSGIERACIELGKDVQ